jgi:predicted GH43/DUF377 family glycosyl hydrolase
MYILMLATIAIILVVIAICISSDVIPPPTLKSSEIVEINPAVLEQTCLHVHTKKYNTILGLYNISVRKVSDGYSGLIRACTWNGCLSSNRSPAFSYPYRVTLDCKGNINELDRIELDYDNFINCTKKFQNVYANGIEDSKLFIYKNEEWAIANCLGSVQQPHPCVNNMCIFKVSDPKNTFILLQSPTGVDPFQPQKNWSPFEYNERLLCEYSIQPHIILDIDVTNGTTKEIYNTSNITRDDISNNILTESSLRGGAAPIIISTTEGPIYLSIGHTRMSKSIGYLHFFYTFEASPPFNIVKISPFFKMDKIETIQFAACLSQENDQLYVSYGVNDCSNRIAQYNIDDILLFLNDCT